MPLRSSGVNPRPRPGPARGCTRGSGLCGGGTPRPQLRGRQPRPTCRAAPWPLQCQQVLALWGVLRLILPLCLRGFPVATLGDCPEQDPPSHHHPLCSAWGSCAKTASVPSCHGRRGEHNMAAVIRAWGGGGGAAWALWGLVPGEQGWAWRASTHLCPQAQAPLWLVSLHLLPLPETRPPVSGLSPWEGGHLWGGQWQGLGGFQSWALGSEFDSTHPPASPTASQAPTPPTTAGSAQLGLLAVAGRFPPFQRPLLTSPPNPELPDPKVLLSERLQGNGWEKAWATPPVPQTLQQGPRTDSLQASSGVPWRVLGTVGSESPGLP